MSPKKTNKPQQENNNGTDSGNLGNRKLSRICAVVVPPQKTNKPKATRNKPKSKKTPLDLSLVAFDKLQNYKTNLGNGRPGSACLGKGLHLSGGLNFVLL